MITNDHVFHLFGIQIDHQQDHQRTSRSGSVSSAVSLVGKSTNPANQQQSQPVKELSSRGREETTKKVQQSNENIHKSVQREELSQQRSSHPPEVVPDHQQNIPPPVFSTTRTEYTSYQDHERYTPQPERVATATNTETVEKPQPLRRTSVETKKTEETQTSDNDSEPDDNSRVVNEIVREQFEDHKQPKKRTESESSNGSTYRKSVSFDLDGDARRPSTNYCSGGSDVENDVFKSNGQRKGILRSPSPFIDREPKNLLTFKPLERNDKEIERDNPFRKEFFRDHDQPQNDPKRARPASVYEPESPQNWSFEHIKQKMEKISRSTVELEQQAADVEFKRQIEGAKSLGQINRGPKPPRPPKPLHIRKANLVYNEGIEDISKKMFQGDFVEFEHDIRTNTIKEVPRPFSPENRQITSPTPSSTSSLDSLRMSRQKSVERPKERPPPPPPPKNISKKSISQEYLNFEHLPLPSPPPPMHQQQWRNENSKVNIVVSQEEHRRIMLQENELRNSLQGDLHLVGLPSNVSQDSDTESYLSSIVQEFSPVSTLQRSISPLKVFPNVEKVPVHIMNLPSPQRPRSLLVEDNNSLQSAGGNVAGCLDTVSDKEVVLQQGGKDDEETVETSDDESDDGIDIDKYLPRDNTDEYYSTATFSTFSGKETQV